MRELATLCPREEEKVENKVHEKYSKYNVVVLKTHQRLKYPAFGT